MLIQRLVDQNFLRLVRFLLLLLGLLRWAADSDAEGLRPHCKLPGLLNDRLVDGLWRPVDVDDVLGE